MKKVVIVAIALSAAATVNAQWVIGRFHVTSSFALFDDGPLTRFQVKAVRDRNNPRTCVLLLHDIEKDTVSIVAVDPGSCD